MSGIDINRFVPDGVGSRALGSIRSIQVVDIVSGTTTYTINTIIPGNSIILMLSFRAVENASFDSPKILSATSVYLDGNGTPAGQALVLEFEPSAVKSKQTGLVENIDDNGTPSDVTINAVNTSKCLVNAFFHYANIHEDSNPDLYSSTVTYSFVDSTTLRLVAHNSSLLGTEPNVTYEILELV
jgi:hypothetical protein